MSGNVLWRGTAFAERSSNNGNNGLVEALIGAVVEQIAGSLSDNTVSLSRQANKNLIQSEHRGLINGPYYQEQGN